MRRGLVLRDGDRVAVVGGGPAGSFFAILLLQRARELGLSLDVVIFDRKDFRYAGPRGCNMCAGAVGNRLLVRLGELGMPLPPQVIRHDIQGYAFHTDGDFVDLRRDEHAHIYGVFRGGGPPGGEPSQHSGTSFDQHLLDYAQAQGARFVGKEVKAIELPQAEGERVRIRYGPLGEESYEAELGVGAFGVNSTLLERVGLDYLPPKTWHACQGELRLGAGYIQEQFRDMIHLFPVYAGGIDYIALTPKGDYLTASAIGRHVKRADLEQALAHSDIRHALPPQWKLSCHCHPKIPVSPARRPYADRFVIIGDASYSRYLKNGIESALYTALFAVEAALEEGISREAFRQSFDRSCRSQFVRDNVWGKLIFRLYRFVLTRRFFSRPHLELMKIEQREGDPRRKALSRIVWNVFSGEAPYREILRKGLHPRLHARLAYLSFQCLWADLHVSGQGSDPKAQDL
ncbi:MAG: hypothetical protein HYY20_04610 [Candidatus Tectomicrobia bacterium]|uniref:NAD(P)/FAD-dependent oxidoreductase n=1 Tax=Tectimicrobiota bacterium TaxID=2528274 RepID=A0A932CNY6_UNCTE|nr:hypothetical protein [Candidatus Tectomicrobia bacterium]